MVAVLFASVFVFILAQSASAAVVGVQQVGSASPSTSVNKGATVACPAGKRVVGAGADVTPGFGEVVIDDVRPTQDLTKVEVFAREQGGGSTSSWYVEARATCAYAPPGLQRVAAISVSNSQNKSVVASCPTGKRLIGTGAEVAPGDGQVSINGVTPNSGLTNVTVRALEDRSGTTANWAVKAYAICANPIGGLERIPGFGAQNSDNSKVVETPCPAGKRVLGSGGSIQSTGKANQLILDAMFTNPDSTGAGFAAWEDPTGTEALWYLAVYAICAPAAERVDLESSATSESFKEVAPTCVPDFHRWGGGFDIIGGVGQGQIWPTRLELDPEAESAILTAVEDGDGYGGNAAIQGQAICGTPLPGEIQVEETAPPEEMPRGQTVTVTCPAGTKVIGAGGLVASSFQLSVFQSIQPEADLSGVTVRSAQSEFPPPDPIRFVITTAQAKCATPPPGLQLVTSRSQSDSGENKTATASCPATKHLVGTGAEIVNAFGHAVIDQIEPDEPLASVAATASETQSDYAGSWWLRVYAICINR